MPLIRNFVGALAGKPCKEIEEMVKMVYGDKTLKKTQLYSLQRQKEDPQSNFFHRHYCHPGCK
jgi:hypothetical protein